MICRKQLSRDTVSSNQASYYDIQNHSPARFAFFIQKASTNFITNWQEPRRIRSAWHGLIWNLLRWSRSTEMQISRSQFIKRLLSWGKLSSCKFMACQPTELGSRRSIVNRSRYGMVQLRWLHTTKRQYQSYDSPTSIHFSRAN